MNDSWWDNFDDEPEGPSGACAWALVGLVVVACAVIWAVWRRHG